MADTKRKRPAEVLTEAEVRSAVEAEPDSPEYLREMPTMCSQGDIRDGRANAKRNILARLGLKGK